MSLTPIGTIFVVNMKKTHVLVISNDSYSQLGQANILQLKKPKQQFFFFLKILFVYLLRLAMLIWRSGQRLERAVAVDPRTQLVPPSTKTRAFLDLYGS